MLFLKYPLDTGLTVQLQHELKIVLFNLYYSIENCAKTACLVQHELMHALDLYVKN